jgi:hypothetical protein
MEEYHKEAKAFRKSRGKGPPKKKRTAAGEFETEVLIGSWGGNADGDTRIEEVWEEETGLIGFVRLGGIPDAYMAFVEACTCTDTISCRIQTLHFPESSAYRIILAYHETMFSLSPWSIFDHSSHIFPTMLYPRSSPNQHLH